ncbi:MAG: penicillin-binding protein activator LpoB [Gammaproteobacteria bacterium]|nr:penicillin-binding protein activator LpoB [Gammaproteobacteria bacterium]
MKYISRVLLTATICSVLLVTTGCMKKGATVQRVSTESTTDLSGAWNDTDSRLVAQEMIQDVLSRPWLSRFNKKKKAVPALIIGRVRNLSHEHINTRTFINDMEKALINSGEVDFVASSSERKEIRSERRDMDINASDATRKEAGQEKGADFMLKGTINTIVDAVAGKHVRFYQVDLTLIDLENNRKVWVGQKKIKKAVARDSYRL